MSVLVGGESWTPEREQRLLQLWNADWSATEIAAELGGGLTRNAVIGKVHRLLERKDKASSYPPPAPPIAAESALDKPASLAEHPARGKYAQTREGFFHTRCADCGFLSAEMSWGKSGSSYAGALLKKAGWTKTGVTSLAVWSCAACSPKAPPQTPSLPTLISQPAAPVDSNDEGLSQLFAPASAPRIGSGPVHYLDRRNNQCAMLLGDPSDLMCCGAPVFRRGASWCEAHHKELNVHSPKGIIRAAPQSKRSGFLLG